MALHEGLGKVLRAFELSSRFFRPENAKAGSAESINDAGGERRLGADDRKGNAFLLHEFNEFLVAGKGNVFELVGQCRTGVAGRHKYLFHAGALRKTPGQSMFTAAAADDEKLHCKILQNFKWEEPAKKSAGLNGYFLRYPVLKHRYGAFLLEKGRNASLHSGLFDEGVQKVFREITLPGAFRPVSGITLPQGARNQPRYKPAERRRVPRGRRSGAACGQLPRLRGAFR